MTTPTPSPKPAYFGSEIDLQHAEILAIGNVDRKLLAPEAALFETKWFDYRQLHPVQATYLMVHHYNRSYGEFMARAMDHTKRFMASFKGKDFMSAREMKSFWRLRQKLDELGIRYDFFLRQAMAWYIAHGWGKQAPSAPRPAHVLNNAELIVDVANAWSQECRARIQFASSPRFLVESWVGAPDQLAYERFLIAQIKQRPHARFGLHAALYVFGHLRIEAALEHFEAHVVADAVELAEQNK